MTVSDEMRAKAAGCWPGSRNGVAEEDVEGRTEWGEKWNWPFCKKIGNE